MKQLLMTFLAAITFMGGSLSVLCQQQTSSVAGNLTLDQAIAMALENNRSAKNARLEVLKAGDRAAATQTRRLPSFKINSLLSQPIGSFDTTFEKGVFGTYSGIGPVPSEDTTITSSTSPTAIVLAQISQPLTQLRRIGFQIKQQQLGQGISEAELRATEQSVVNDVKRAYYAILQTQAASTSAAEAVKLYRELDRVTGEYVMQQVALKTDQMDVQTRLAKAEYQVLTIKNQLSAEKEQLNLLLGRDVTTNFSVSEDLETSQVMMRETDLTKARQLALTQRPEISEARLKVAQAKLDRRAKKSEYIPDVSLTLSYVSTFNSSNFTPRSVSGLGISVEWEVFDWGRKKRELDEKSRTVSESDNNLLETQSRVLIEVNDRYRKLEETCQQIRIAKLAQTQARANVQMAAFKYRVDAVLLKDVLQAQTSLADANYEYQKALLSFWTAKADFEKAMGEDK